MTWSDPQQTLADERRFRAMRIEKIAIGAWFVYSLCGCAERQPVDTEFVAGLAIMVHAMQLQRDTCIALYPASRPTFMREYKQSAVPEYAQLLKYERTFDFRDQHTRLDSLGMSEEEARVWCDNDYVQSLAVFDARYAGYISEVAATLPEIEDAAKQVAAQRAEELANPAGEQNERLFDAIVESLNLSFSTGDWSILARLYEDGTFDCWSRSGDVANFNFLAKPPIPDDAKHQIRKLEGGYGQGSMIAQPNPAPTHLMEIWFEVSYPSRCGDQQSHRWPRYHFLLNRSAEGYRLVHGCPTEMYFERLAEGPVWPTLSRAEVDAALSELPASEWERIPDEIHRNGRVAETVSRLQTQYGVISHDKAYLIVDAICRLPEEQ